MEKGTQKKGLIFASFGGIAWGISGVASQYLFGHYDIEADWLTSIRMVSTGLILLAWVTCKSPDQVGQVWQKTKNWLHLLAFSFFGLLLCQAAFLSAIAHSNSATATVLQSLNVVIMALLMSFWYKRPMTRPQVLAILLALVGTFLLTSKGNIGSLSLSMAGLFFGLLSAVGVVTNSLLSRSLIQEFGNFVITGWGMLIGGTGFLLFTKNFHLPSHLDAFAWLLLFVIIIIGTVLAFTAFLEGVRLIGPVKATLIGCLEPASATLLSVIFLGSRFSLWEVLGFLFIIGTVFLSVWNKKVPIEKR